MSGSSSSCESGSATIWVLLLAVLLASVGVASVLVVSGLAAHRHASSAADLAALAGAATSTTDQLSACVAASRSASDNAAELVSCQIVEHSLIVVVRVEADSPWLPGFSVAARAGHP